MPLECSIGLSGLKSPCMYHRWLCPAAWERSRTFPAHLVLERIFRVDVAGAGSAFNLWRTGGRRLGLCGMKSEDFCLLIGWFRRRVYINRFRHGN